MRLFTRRTQLHSPLSEDDEPESDQTYRPPNNHISKSRALVLVLAFLATTAIGFFFGQKSVDDRILSLNIPLRLEPRTFLYNRTFGEPPSTDTDRAWAELFPAQGGFFKHPKLAPKRSALSVFHQLHCLNGIREGYWALHDAATSGNAIKESDMPIMSSTSHIRHCIDLLRNALMCQADTTVEVKNDALGGVTGFGTEHRCVDWERLMAWVGDWEGHGQDEETRVKAEEEHRLGATLERHEGHVD